MEDVIRLNGWEQVWSMTVQDILVEQLKRIDARLERMEELIREANGRTATNVRDIELLRQAAALTKSAHMGFVASMVEKPWFPYVILVMAAEIGGRKLGEVIGLISGLLGKGAH